MIKIEVNDQAGWDRGFRRLKKANECGRRGLPPGCPETPHDAPTKKVVLRPGEYHRVTSARRVSSCDQRQGQ